MFYEDSQAPDVHEMTIMQRKRLQESEARRTYEVFIPFCGFFKSWINEEIDSCIEREEEYRGSEIYAEEIDYDAISRNYVNLYVITLNDALRNKGREDLKIKLQFKQLYSPRYYNFETDRILCTTANKPTMLREIYAVLCGDNLDQDIQRKFRSRDGFVSFYSDFANNWRNKPVDEWDDNELSVLLPDFDLEEFSDHALTVFRESIANHLQFATKE